MEESIRHWWEGRKSLCLFSGLVPLSVISFDVTENRKGKERATTVYFSSLNSSFTDQEHIENNCYIFWEFPCESLSCKILQKENIWRCLITAIPWEKPIIFIFFPIVILSISHFLVLLSIRQLFYYTVSLKVFEQLVEKLLVEKMPFSLLCVHLTWGEVTIIIIAWGVRLWLLGEKWAGVFFFSSSSSKWVVALSHVYLLQVVAFEGWHESR